MKVRSWRCECARPTSRAAPPRAGKETMPRPLHREVARRGAWSVAALLLLVLLPGCRTEPPPSYIRLHGAAPALEDVPAAHALLVVFWASWCPPCREETPGLLELAEKPPEGLRVVVFSHDTHPRAVEAFLGGPPAPGLHLRQLLPRARLPGVRLPLLPPGAREGRGGRAARLPRARHARAPRLGRDGARGGHRHTARGEAAPGPHAGRRRPARLQAWSCPIPTAP